MTVPPVATAGSCALGVRGRGRRGRKTDQPGRGGGLITRSPTDTPGGRFSSVRPVPVGSSGHCDRLEEKGGSSHLIVRMPAPLVAFSVARFGNHNPLKTLGQSELPKALTYVTTVRV